MAMKVEGARCFWPTGCGDRVRCAEFGQCVAGWQNAHKDELFKGGQRPRPMKVWHDEGLLPRYQGWLDGRWPVIDGDDAYAQLRRIALLMGGLAAESGELIALLEKSLRDPARFPHSRARVVDEAGDVLHYVAMILRRVDSSLEEALEYNMTKINARHNR